MYMKHGQELIEAFENVLHHLNILCLHIYDDLPKETVVVYDEKKGFAQNKDKAIYALKNMGIPSNFTPQETYSCPGAIGGTTKTIEMIANVNTAKIMLKNRVQECKAQIDNDISKFVRDILARAGHIAVKLKQVYRQIRLIDDHPRRIAWIKGRHSTHIIITKKQAQELLLKKGQGEHIQLQLNKLSLLKPQHKLIIHRPIKPIWIANVTSVKDKSRANYQCIRTSLPIFYLLKSGIKVPEVCFGAHIDRADKPRGDKKIEDEPFLRSIHAYRYKSNSKLVL